MRICPFCGREIPDEEFAELVKAKAATAGRATSERKKAAAKRNMEKARAAISPERRKEILEKALAAREAKRAAKQDKEQ